MAGTYRIGEEKVRPGSYFHIKKYGDNALIGSVDGIVAVLFRSDWGPLKEAVEVKVEEGYERIFGTALTTDAIQEAFTGGAMTAICCRIGNGGTKSSVKLKVGSEDAVTLSAKYVGEKECSVTIRERLSDSSKKECILYEGTKMLETIVFEKGGEEVSTLVEAFLNSNYFDAEKVGSVTGEFEAVSQVAFTTGTNPTVTNEDYSNGFGAVEKYYFNTICVDTEDTAVHGLLATYLDRIFNAGQLVMAVVAEKKTIPLLDRMSHAAAFNDEKMHYILNAAGNKAGQKIEGYQTAARIAGMIAACASNQSLTHTVLEGVTELEEMLTSTQMIQAEKSGCLVLSRNTKNQIMIDSAINTLMTPSENQDDGWKKIRRTKTRYELIKRVNEQIDLLIGKVDNDKNGRATMVSQIQGICNAMVEERKLTSCKVIENASNRSDGDAAWFDIYCMDKDSAERIYFTFQFKYSTQEG